MKICEECQKKFIPKYPSLMKQRFCSRSCSAKHTNSTAKKRPRTKKCKRCGELILAMYTYCPLCIGKGAHLRSGTHLSERSIRDVIYRVGSNRYGVVRSHAKLVAKDLPKICRICRYDKHVEICHIKDISEFPLETKVGVVNSLSNLIFLCPNCHWEFDNGMLKI